MDMFPCNDGGRSSDGTRWQVLDMVKLDIHTGVIVRKVDLQVLGIKASFNMLLGRPWILSIHAISSTLHQKVRFPLNGKVVTIDASNFRTTTCHKEKTTSVVLIEPIEELCGFDVISVIENEDNWCPNPKDAKKVSLVKDG